MSVERELPSDEARDLLDMVRQVGDAELAPRCDDDERAERFPREVFGRLGELGLLGLAFPLEHGGGGQPYAVYLQVVEELAMRWTSVALGVSVHTLSAFPVLQFGSSVQRQELAERMAEGTWLGAYCLSEAQAGSDPAAVAARARRDGQGWVADGAKTWVTHGGHADYYTTFLRTSDDAGRGLSCFHIPSGAPGLSFSPPEQKMGLTASHTATANLDGAWLAEHALIGEVGQGLPIALAALDSGRLGVSAVAVGLAQCALEHAVAYAKERETFGRKVIDHQGLGFLLADMAAAVESARATYLHAARLKDAGRPFARQASVAKLVATDAAMRVTTDAVQVFGGAGYTRDFPVERLMREAKVMQIFEGTNQIQRMVIARHLARS